MIQVPKKKVLFVGMGNSCRSQMAEAFARAYGHDVLISASAGLVPDFAISPDAGKAMAAKNIDMREQYPKAVRQLGPAVFDYVFNLTGTYLPGAFGMAKVSDWEVPDPQDFEEHCLARDDIERRVQELVVGLRARTLPKFRGQGSGRLPL